MAIFIVRWRRGIVTGYTPDTSSLVSRPSGLSSRMSFAECTVNIAGCTSLLVFQPTEDHNRAVRRKGDFAGWESRVVAFATEELLDTLLEPQASFWEMCIPASREGEAEWLSGGARGLFISR